MATEIKPKPLAGRGQRNASPYIGPHSDDERQLVPNSPVYSFSFGQSRDFHVVTKVTKNFNPDIKIETLKIPMTHNSLIIMGGQMHKHSVPKRALSKCPDSRINVIIRMFK